MYQIFRQTLWPLFLHIKQDTSDRDVGTNIHLPAALNRSLPGFWPIAIYAILCHGQELEFFSGHEKNIVIYIIWIFPFWDGLPWTYHIGAIYIYICIFRYTLSVIILGAGDSAARYPAALPQGFLPPRSVGRCPTDLWPRVANMFRESMYLGIGLDGVPKIAKLPHKWLDHGLW